MRRPAAPVGSLTQDRGFSVSPSLREELQLATVSLREGRASVVPVSEVTIRLKPIPGRDRFASSIDQVLRWIAKRAGQHLPDTAWHHESFELADIGAQRTAAVSLPEVPYWAARLDDADKSVPLRTWVTEVGIGLTNDGDVLFGTRLICATRGERELFDRSVPGFVRSIVDSGQVQLDGVAIPDGPPVLQSETDVDWLVRLLEQRDRRHDVVVASLPEGSVDASQAAINAQEMFARTLGAAHVCVLSGPASFMLTERVGKELSVYRQAVRTYRPGFKSWLDDPWRHPLVLPERIAQWNAVGPQDFLRELVNWVLATTVRSIDREQELPPFNTIRQIAAQQERERLKSQGANDTELLMLYESDNESLRTEIKEQKSTYEDLLSEAENERDQAREQADRVNSENFALRARIRALEQQRSKMSESPKPTIPDTLDDFEDWCRENLVGSVELLGRAFQGVRKSVYSEPTFLYRALLLLRDYYVPMRTAASPENRAAYEKALRDLNLEESPTGEGTRFDEDLYSVQYGGQRRVLDRHLKRGGSRDPRYCFRVYFFWDDEKEVVVVGWLPSHLENRMT